jgi:hypothetical protein
MTATFFFGFVAVVAATVVVLIARYLGREIALRSLVGICVWFIYVGVLRHSGVLNNPRMRPPGILLVLAPVIVFLVVFIVRTAANSHAALAFPLWILLGLQCFRIGVELFLHQLWLLGIVPRMLTFAGANVDIYIGASAPLIAWLSTRGRFGFKLALGWNVLGLLALANVVVRAVLTSPGPLNLLETEIPNRIFGTFPFVFIPGFFVPLAVALHVLAIRAIRSRLGAASAGNPA